MSITKLKPEVNEASKNAMGGTEIMMARLYESLPDELLEKFQIIPSRVRDLKKDKVRLLYIHNLAGDPEFDCLKNEGWKKFHKLIFVSHQQMQSFIYFYNIPWSRCVVIPNSITPIELDYDSDKKSDKLKLIYQSVPRKGLEILVPVFNKLREKYDNIELDVFSSFALYGWPDADKQYEALIKECKDSEGINYHGSVANDEVRKAVAKAHIFAYPNIFMECSPLTLLENMSGALLCVHPNLGPLPEISANWTEMYQFHEDHNAHANILYSILDSIIPKYDPFADNVKGKLMAQKKYIDLFYNWEFRIKQWEELLISMKDLPTDFEEQYFIYRTS